MNALCVDRIPPVTVCPRPVRSVRCPFAFRVIVWGVRGGYVVVRAVCSSGFRHRERR